MSPIQEGDYVVIRVNEGGISSLRGSALAKTTLQAFSKVQRRMSEAEQLSTRLSAAESLMDPSVPATHADNAPALKLLQKLAGSTFRATTLVHTGCLDVTDTRGHVSEALVGWTGDQVHLREQYVGDVGAGPAKLRSANVDSSYEEQVDAIRGGGTAIFSAAGNLAESIAFFYKSRTST